MKNDDVSEHRFLNLGIVKHEVLLRSDDGSNKNGSKENGSNSGLPTYFREVKID